MERPDYDEEIEFWRKRAEYYEKMCMTLIADISDGVKFDSITIDEDGIKFTKKQPERKKGKWMKHNDKACWYCSECKKDNYYAYCWNSDTGKYEIQDHYCPNCGAEMEGGRWT